MTRVINILFALDCLLFSLCTLGKSYPYESFSSAAYRAELNGRMYGNARALIDALFFFDPGHCQRAYSKAILNLPPDQRFGDNA